MTRLPQYIDRYDIISVYHSEYSLGVLSDKLRNYNIFSYELRFLFVIASVISMLGK